MRARFAAPMLLFLMMVPEAGRDHNGFESRGRWWQAAGVQRDLQLTAEQIVTLDALFERGLPERLARHQKLEEMDRLLERILERGNADEASVARLSEQVEALRAQQNTRRTLMLLAMYRTLTRQQRTAFIALRQAAARRSASLPHPESPPRRD